VRLHLASAQAGKQLVASLSRYGPSKNIAIVSEYETCLLVHDFAGTIVRCQSHEEVAEEIHHLAVYARGCWNCKRPIVPTADNRCPKCNRYEQCTCGKCLCDKYSIRRALSPEECAALAKELNRRYGHLFRAQDPETKDDAHV
jgi:hypothetical protein